MAKYLDDTGLSYFWQKVKNYIENKISGIPTPDVSGQISTHNSDTTAHNDIRKLITGLTNIKVNVADIINNLTTNVSNKPLSAAQGVALKKLIDAIKVPTKVGELENDSGYLTSYTETDPTVPTWAKASSKPSYTASEVGALPISGGTLTGNLTGKYLTGTWLQSTADNHMSSSPAKIAVQDGSGWIYYRTLAELMTDLGVPAYTTCNTAADTQAKVATTAVSRSFALKVGAMVRVKFTNAQSYNGQPTLNVNSTGAKNIVKNGTSAGMRYMWAAGEVLDFVYDGANWVCVDGATASTTYYGVTKLSSSTTSTSGSMAATPAAVKSALDQAKAYTDSAIGDAIAASY